MQLLACHNGRLLRTTLSLAVAGDDANDDAADVVATSLRPGRTFRTDLPALDALAPSGAFACGAIHEILADPIHGPPKFFAALLARAAMNASAGRHDARDARDARDGRDGRETRETREARTRETREAREARETRETREPCGRGGAIVWCDPDGELYPPALAQMGMPLDRLYLLRPRTLADEAWAVAECLRCPGVAATVATVRPGRGPRDAFTRTHARRLQLAAERGGGVGILIRPWRGHAIGTRTGTSKSTSASTSAGTSAGTRGTGAIAGTRGTGMGASAGEGAGTRAAGAGAGARTADIYAAVTRWLIEPAAGERNVQRWKIQLIHGHGGRLNQAVILEHCRDRSGDPRPTHLVRAFAELADRPVPAKAAETRRMRISA